MDACEDNLCDLYTWFERDAREQEARAMVLVHIVSYIAQTLMGSVERRSSAGPNTWPRGSEERASQGQRSCNNTRAVDADDAEEAKESRTRRHGPNSEPDCGA